MDAHFSRIDWIVLVGYFAGTMGVGAYFYRRTRSPEQFMAAGRSLPGWVCGLSIFATYLSSISYLALPGKSFVGNWNSFAFSLSIPLAAAIAARWFLPYYRSSGEVSAYALLERRFGAWARVYARTFYLLTQIARMGVVMYLMALPMAVIFGWDIRTVIMLTGVAVTLYSFLGGVVAVIWTDAIQALVLMAGALGALAVMVAGVDGGLPTVIEVGKAHDKFSLGPYHGSLAEPTLWVVLLYGFVINLQNFGIDQSYVQRYIASRSDAEARRGLWLGALLYVPVSALFFFIGTTLFAFYGSQPGEIDEVKRMVAWQQLMQAAEGRRHEAAAPLLTAPALDEAAAKVTLTDVGDRAFPHFIAKHLPPGVTGLLVAAIFAAAMSTVSTSLNSSATLVLRDYYERFWNPAATPAQAMGILYGATLAWGVLGTAMALVLVRVTESALDIWWEVASRSRGGRGGFFRRGMVVRRASSRGAIPAVLAGSTLIAWMAFSPATWGRLDRIAQPRPNEAAVLDVSRPLSGRASAGDRIEVQYAWIDTKADLRRNAREVHTIAGLSTDGRQITLAADLDHAPVGAVVVFADNAWRRWRSPFHSYLAIVFGAAVILAVGLSLAQWEPRHGPV